MIKLTNVQVVVYVINVRNNAIRTVKNLIFESRTQITVTVTSSQDRSSSPTGTTLGSTGTTPGSRGFILQCYLDSQNPSPEEIPPPTELRPSEEMSPPADLPTDEEIPPPAELPPSEEMPPADLPPSE